MQTKFIAIIVVVAIVIAASLFAFMHSGSQHSTSALTQNKSTVLQNSSKVLFSSTQYAPYSYLISPGSISPQAQAALAGFNFSSSNLSNGSRLITIDIIGTKISKSLTLGPGYKLYIVETTFGDDGYHFDSSLGDDGFVTVDPQGYVA